MKKKRQIITVEILNLSDEWCEFDVEVWENGTIIDLHPDEVHLYPSIFVSSDGRWQDEWQRLTRENAHLALNIESPHVRNVS